MHGKIGEKMTHFEIWTLIGGGGIALGITKLIFHLGKIAKTIETIQRDLFSHKNDVASQFSSHRQEMNEFRQEVNENFRNIDRRLSHLEGAFFERGQWEAKLYKAEDKK
jgi:hypothetical protein